MVKTTKNSSAAGVQVERFREAARELGCNEDEAAFDAALKRIGSAPSPRDDKPKKDKPGQ